MNRFVIAIAAVAAFSATALAQKPKAPPAPKPAPQTTCAVTGEKLGDMGKPISIAYAGKNPAYKGKSVLVCCGGCVAKVKADPDTYFKKVYAPAKPAPKPATSGG